MYSSSGFDITMVSRLATTEKTEMFSPFGNFDIHRGRKRTNRESLIIKTKNVKNTETRCLSIDVQEVSRDLKLNYIINTHNRKFLLWYNEESCKRYPTDIGLEDLSSTLPTIFTSKFSR